MAEEPVTEHFEFDLSVGSSGLGWDWELRVDKGPSLPIAAGWERTKRKAWKAVEAAFERQRGWLLNPESRAYPNEQGEDG